MKSIYLVLVLLILTGTSLFAQKINANYDSTLAKKLGADEHGMKYYTLVILKSGKNKSTEKNFRDSCFAGHMKNISRLVENNKLIIAGPFEKNESDFRGLFILNVSEIDEAKKLLETDPAIHAGFLEPELYQWYGSAAIPEYLDASDKVWKERN
jgi:uncharacterized protein YciI